MKKLFLFFTFLIAIFAFTAEYSIAQTRSTISTKCEDLSNEDRYEAWISSSNKSCAFADGEVCTSRECVTNGLSHRQTMRQPMQCLNLWEDGTSLPNGRTCTWPDGSSCSDNDCIQNIAQNAVDATRPSTLSCAQNVLTGTAPTAQSPCLLPNGQLCTSLSCLDVGGSSTLSCARNIISGTAPTAQSPCLLPNGQLCTSLSCLDVGGTEGPINDDPLDSGEPEISTTGPCQGVKDFKYLLCVTTENIIRPLAAIIVALTFLYFLWGIAKYLKAGDKDKQGAKDAIFWGIIALFVMVSVWGLVNLLISTFDLDNTRPPVPSVSMVSVNNPWYNS